MSAHSDMDSVFQLSNGERVTYLRNLMHSFGSSYICLWTYSPLLDILCCEDGHFQLEASSSTGVSIAEKLFNDYKQCVINVGNSIIPGLAFRDKNPCLELKELDLQSLSHSKSQRQFYREAKIKTALFFGCERGEIELGMSNIIPKPQKVETKMQSSEMGMKDVVPRVRGRDDHEEGVEQSAGDGEGAVTTKGGGGGMRENKIEMDDPQYKKKTTAGNIMRIIDDKDNKPSISYALPFPFPFPSAESTDEALTKAYLAILSSSSPPCSSSSSSTSSSQSYSLPPLIITASSRKTSAFTGYHHHETTATRRQQRRPTLFKRAVAFYRGIHFKKVAANLQWQNFTPSSAATTKPTSNQLHHMISERRRREKINDSFQALRSLLPQPTKKDKATVLRTTNEYLSSLKAQVSELITKNQELEAKLKETTYTSPPASLIGNETFSVQLIPVAPYEESTSTQTLFFDLRLLFRGDASLNDLLFTLLPFLKHHTTLVSIHAQTQQLPPPHQVHLFPTTTWLTFRLTIIQGVEWDESAFIEAIRRLLADFIG